MTKNRIFMLYWCPTKDFWRSKMLHLMCIFTSYAQADQTRPAHSPCFEIIMWQYCTVVFKPNAWLELYPRQNSYTEGFQKCGAVSTIIAIETIRLLSRNQRLMVMDFVAAVISSLKPDLFEQSKVTVAQSGCITLPSDLLRNAVLSMTTFPSTVDVQVATCP